MFTIEITKNQAELIHELLLQAGWFDDLEMLVDDIKKESGPEAAQAYLDSVDGLIEKINTILN